MKRIALFVELLLIWLLPVAWLGLCLAVFSHWEPSEEYSNSPVYLFLAVIWLFSVKKLKTSLLVRRAKIWGGAALLCATASLTGLMFFVVYPLAWAGWFVFFPSLLVLISTLPDRSKGNASQTPPTPAVPT